MSFQEWGKCPHEYLGAYKLEHDFSWTPAKEVEKRQNDFAAIDKVLNSQAALTFDSRPNFQGLTDPKISEETQDSS